MERTNGRTEPLASATIATEIRGDAPSLRPRRTIPCRVRVWTGEGFREADAPFTVTFLDAAVWDVARIAPARLEVRNGGDPAARLGTRMRPSGRCDILWLERTVSLEPTPRTTAVLFGDARRTSTAIVDRAA